MPLQLLKSKTISHRSTLSFFPVCRHYMDRLLLLVQSKKYSLAALICCLSFPPSFFPTCRHYMGRLLPLVQSKKYDIAAIISHRLPLSEGPAAYRLFDGKAGGCTKVVMRPWPATAAAAEGAAAAGEQGA